MCVLSRGDWIRRPGVLPGLVEQPEPGGVLAEVEHPGAQVGKATRVQATASER